MPDSQAITHYHKLNIPRCIFIKIAANRFVSPSDFCCFVAVVVIVVVFIVVAVGVVAATAPVACDAILLLLLNC